MKLEKQCKPIEPQGKTFKDLIIPRKNFLNKLSMLILLYGAIAVSSMWNYDKVEEWKNQGFSRNQIETGIYEMPAKGKNNVGSQYHCIGFREEEMLK